MKDEPMIINFKKFRGYGLESRTYELEAGRNLPESIEAVEKEADEAGYVGPLSEVPVELWEKHGFTPVINDGFSNPLIVSKKAPPVRLARCWDCPDNCNDYCGKYKKSVNGHSYMSCGEGEPNVYYWYGNDRDNVWGPFIVDDTKTPAEIMTYILTADHSKECPEMQNYCRWIQKYVKENCREYSADEWKSDHYREDQKSKEIAKLKRQIDELERKIDELPDN